MACPLNVADYSFGPEDRFFLDTNVWLLTNGVQRPKKDSRVDTYSDALKRMLDAKSCIYVDVLVISEFINVRMAREKGRLEFSGTVKKFRQHPEFREVMRDIVSDAKRILEICVRVNGDFANLDMPPLLKECSEGSSDFNDLVIADLCRKNDLKLVTDDGDFAGVDLPILTANEKLLTSDG